MEKYGGPLKAGDTFYEMGCASGRVLRHFAVQHDDLNVWGSDINNRHIEWMRLNLPENINIFSEYYSSSVTAGVEQCRYSLCIFCFYTY
jgi:methylase of polypeptide subunit release factors